MPNWLEYAELLQQFVPQKLSPDATDCASIWIVLHRNWQPVALVRDMMMARMQSLLDARRLEEARSCGDLLVNAAQQTVALGQAVGGDSIADAMQLRSRVYAAQLDHAAAIKELEDALALAPTSRPYLWVELARLRHARRHDEPTALAGAAEAMEAALALLPGAPALWDMLSDAFHQLGRANFSYVPRAIAAVQASARLAPRATQTWTNLAKASC